MPDTQTQSIHIDIEVHRSIEARRTSFSQSHNDILRSVFDLPVATPLVQPNKSPSSTQRRRRTGTYVVALLGRRIEAGSLREAYVSCLKALAERDSQFLEALSKKQTRSRRIVARNPRDLYLRRPQLAENHASKLVGPWWADTNLSRQQCEKRLQTACSVAGLEFGRDLGLEFPD